MQTFVPFDDPRASAVVLDRARLGKQRVECLQLLNALTGESRGWGNHPAARMWRGYERALTVYGCIVCQVWTERGYRDTCREKMLLIVPDAFDVPVVWPPWWGQLELQISHRSNLVRKAPEHYRPYFGDVPDDLEYIWPV